jgi:hypothetical protein
MGEIEVKPFDIFRTCQECIYFWNERRFNPREGRNVEEFCEKHGAQVPKDFQPKGCDDWDKLPF